MTLLETTCAAIREPDLAVRERTQEILDRKTKPRRSLGRLEDLAAAIAAMRGTSELPLPEKAIVVMAADHGVAQEGVSAYPQEVTAQMLANFEGGGAAINVLARQLGIRLEVVDMGVGSPTANFVLAPAMSLDQARTHITRGIETAQTLVRDGITLIGLGDMGIANTTASSAMTAAFFGLDPELVVGRGTGIDDEGLARKIEVIRRALALHQPDPRDGLGVLAALGGFEIAGLAGVVLGAAAQRVPVVLDGFITSVAALAAARIAPAAGKYLIASHRSVEQGHTAILEDLGLAPLLDLDLRLGEGSGAALSMGLIESAVRILAEMATFDSAGVTDAGA